MAVGGGVDGRTQAAGGQKGAGGVQGTEGQVVGDVAYGTDDGVALAEVIGDVGGAEPGGSGLTCLPLS
jgi:hypothetical protein